MHTKAERGFYYHYKHDPRKGPFDLAYEVIGVAYHTELPDRDSGALVVYRPLYESSEVYKGGKASYARPLSMFFETITKDGGSFLRFSRVTDKEIIALFEKKKEEMYGTN